MLDTHGNEWNRLSHPLTGERCQTDGCPSRKRLGSDLCFEHHRGEPSWSEEHQCWLPPERELHWCSLIDNRQLVLL